MTCTHICINAATHYMIVRCARIYADLMTTQSESFQQTNQLDCLACMNNLFIISFSCYTGAGITKTLSRKVKYIFDIKCLLL